MGSDLRRAAGVVGLMFGLGLCGTAVVSAGESARAPKPTFRGRVDPATAFLLGQALERASARVAEPACEAVFSEFGDSSGRTLKAALDLSGFTGRAYLGLLFFADGSGHDHCESGRIGAFTVPGSRVVHVCPANVRRLSKLDPALVDVLLIHELLHALGLPENPPTPEEITARVNERCVAKRAARDRVASQ